MKWENLLYCWTLIYARAYLVVFLFLYSSGNKMRTTYTLPSNWSEFSSIDDAWVPTVFFSHIRISIVRKPTSYMPSLRIYVNIVYANCRLPVSVDVSARHYTALSVSQTGIFIHRGGAIFISQNKSYLKSFSHPNACGSRKLNSIIFCGSVERRTKPHSSTRKTVFKLSLRVRYCFCMVMDVGVWISFQTHKRTQSVELLIKRIIT